jgi:hypothetical protein
MFDGGDGLQGATALEAVLDVDLEHSLSSRAQLMGAGGAAGLDGNVAARGQVVARRG